MAKEKNNIYFLNDQTICVHGIAGAFELADDWQKANESTQFRTWAMEGIPDEGMDGALIEIQPGGRTPVQFVRSETTFWEVPYSGKLTLLLVSPKGELEMHHFDSNQEEASYMYVAQQGWTMCWLAHRHQDSPTHIIECEIPGFKSADLPTVPFGVNEFDGNPLPREFWAVIQAHHGGVIKI